MTENPSDRPSNTTVNPGADGILGALEELAMDGET
jgi:hypothetical protein